MTKLKYMMDTYLFEDSSIIRDIGVDNNGSYFILDETIIYPQGGGQPSDVAFCKNVETGAIFEVKMAKIIDSNSRNYYNSEQTLSVDEKILVTLNKERRLTNAKYHTAAHLIADIVLNEYNTVAVKGHQFPSEAYIETNSEVFFSNTELQEKLNHFIEKDLKVVCYNIERDDYFAKFGKTPYYIPEEKIFRVCRIGDFLPVPCGGTHVSDVREIGNIVIKKIVNKKGISRISYGL